MDSRRNQGQEFFLPAPACTRHRATSQIIAACQNLFLNWQFFPADANAGCRNIQCIGSSTQMSSETILLPRRIWSLAIGFPGLHALNMVLSIAYTLLQALIFARVLPPTLFSQTIAATAISIYALPLNQSVARANFVLLRERMVRNVSDDGMPEAAAAFYANQIISGIVPLATPPLLGVADWSTYVSLACYLFFCTYTNIWVLEVQMTMMATGRAMRFEHVNTLRRALIFLTVGWLMIDRDFLLFTILAATQSAVFHVYALYRIAGNSQLFAWPRGLTGAATRAHLGRLRVSLQATFAEWVAFNAPYAVFMVRFGIGPELVAIDAVLKLVRAVVSIARNLSEIALPRVSYALLSANAAKARFSVLLVMLVSGVSAAALAFIVLFDEHRAFNFLLGPNNTMPPGAGAPSAIAILAAVAFATGGHLIGYTASPRMIRWFMIAPIGATALFIIVMLAYQLGVLQGLWAFALTQALVSVVCLWLLERLTAR